MGCLDENTALQYVEGLLGGEREREVEAHAARCAECRWLLNEAGGAVLEEGSSAAITQQARPRPARAPAQEQPTARRIGEVLANTYVVERYIGRGGMGTVYEGSHRRLPRRFAIKFLSAAYSGDRVATARIKREAEITSKLSHPNIVEVVDFDHAEDGTPYIVMALLEGESLAARLQREGPYRDLGQVAELLRQVTAALAAAHAEQVIHRDLKPSNIFLCRSAGGAGPTVKLVDFGLSKIAGAARTRESSLTQVRSVLGSPSFMSPEQASGRTAEADARADIFGLGATLFAMLTGRPPFGGETVDEKLIQVAGGELVETPLWRQLPRQLQQVIERALSKDPAARQGSMEQLWRELSAALGVAAGRASGRSRRLVLGIGLAVAVLAGLGVAGGLLLRRSAVRPPPPPAPAPRAAAPVGRADARSAPAAPARRSITRRPTPRRAKRARPARPPRRAAARGVGTLVVQSKARSDGSSLWANVLLDGARVGQTALKLERVPAGVHRLEVRRPGYRPVTRTVRVQAGQRTRVLVELSAAR